MIPGKQKAVVVYGLIEMSRISLMGQGGVQLQAVRSLLPVDVDGVGIRVV